MIRVSWDPGELELRVEGHAGSAPAGSDLICAGASVLWLTLRETLGENAERAERTGPRFFESSGTRRVVCCPKPEAEEECRTILETMAAGYRALAESFPDYVSFEGGGGYPAKKK